MKTAPRSLTSRMTFDKIVYNLTKGGAALAVFYLETGSCDPAYNLAFEEYVLKYRTVGSYLILWQNHNAVIIGRNQNAEAEINRTFVDRNGIRVVRRNTGGGAVYHDLGNLNYSFISDAGPSESRTAARFTVPVVRTLRKLGLDAEASGRNDILVGGRKVSGTAQQLLHGRILHHGTLLFDSDGDMIAGALNPDPTKFQSKSIQSVRSRVGSIRHALSRDMTMPEFWQYLKNELCQEDMLPASLSEEELSAVCRLKEEKYDTWEWNFGRSPAFQTVCRQRHSGGLLEIHLTVNHGIIQDIRILGDFLAITELSPLEQALSGCTYEESAIRQILEQFPLSDYLGSITCDEFLNTILHKTKEAS